MCVCFRRCCWQTADVFHFVFMVAQFTSCAVRSEADVTPAWRNQAFVSSSRLLGHVACVISVANMFPFSQFPLSFNNWKHLDALWLYKETRLHFYGDMIWQQAWDYTDLLTSGEQRRPLESHLFFEYVLKKPCFSLAETLFACISASFLWNMLLAVTIVKVKCMSGNIRNLQLSL